MIGSSIAEGLYVQRSNSFAALLPLELSERTGRKIELYNEGMIFGFSHSQTLRFDDALRQSPDLLFWPISPEDVRSALELLPDHDSRQESKAERQKKLWRRAKAILDPRSTIGAVGELFDRTDAAIWLRSLLFTSENQYLRSYLMPGNDSAGFLLTEPTSGWKDRLAQFDTDAANIEGRAKAAGVPFVATLLPFREQAAMISMGEWPGGYDPYKLDNELRSIITRHGGIYVSVLGDFRNIPNPERLYFPIDGHPTIRGHAVISHILAKELTGKIVQALSSNKAAR
ncbi:SGNH/GDSL hydrolase family protein [Acidobacteria bacterium AB60]|nr:SGNH/GDSL hydrolase family protein [Acidobacteria bacterium AB60]